MVDKLVNSKANYNRIKSIEECFRPLGEPLLIPGRVLIGEGILYKMCRKGLKERIFFLFNDVLVYGNIVIKKKVYNKQHIIPLEEIKLETLNHKENENGWLIKTTFKSFAVYSSTKKEKEEWMLFIQKCIEDVLRRKDKTIGETFAPVWVPDMEAPLCMCCKKSPFTAINRRHHCRNCGDVVCNSCSNKKFLLPHLSPDPVRVCQDCFDKLSKPELKIDLKNKLLSVVLLRKAQSDSSLENQPNSDSDETICHSIEGLKNHKNRKSIFYSLEDITNNDS